MDYTTLKTLHLTTIAISLALILVAKGFTILMPFTFKWATDALVLATGGKMEAGETVAHSLERELREELGIEFTATHDSFRPLMIVEHDYPHASVRLHVCIVTRWRGEPRAMEGQEFSWQTAHDNETAVSPMLPAVLPINEALKKTRSSLRDH